jgi:hypothetical protein
MENITKQHSYIRYLLVEEFEEVIAALIYVNAPEELLTEYNFYAELNDSNVSSGRTNKDKEKMLNTWQNCYCRLIEGKDEKSIVDINMSANLMHKHIFGILSNMPSQIEYFKNYRIPDIMDLLTSLLKNDIDIDKTFVSSKLKSWNEAWYIENYNKILVRILRFTFMKDPSKYESIIGSNNEMCFQLHLACFLDEKYVFNKAEQKIILEFVEAEQNMIKDYDDIFEFNKSVPIYMQAITNNYNILDENHLEGYFKSLVDAIDFINNKDLAGRMMEYVTPKYVEYSNRNRDERFTEEEDKFLKINENQDLPTLFQSFQEKFPQKRLRTQASLKKRLERLQIFLFLSEGFNDVDFLQEYIFENRPNLEVLKVIFASSEDDLSVEINKKWALVLAIAKNYSSHIANKRQQHEEQQQHEGRQQQNIRNLKQVKQVLSGNNSKVESLLKQITEKIDNLNKINDKVAGLDDNDENSNNEDYNYEDYNNEDYNNESNDDEHDTNFIQSNHVDENCNNNTEDETNNFQDQSNNTSRNGNGRNSSSTGNKSNSSSTGNKSNSNNTSRNDNSTNRGSSSSTGNKSNSSSTGNKSNSSSIDGSEKKNQFFSNTFSVIRTREIENRSVTPPKTMLVVGEYFLNMNDLGNEEKLTWQKLNNEEANQQNNFISRLDEELRNAPKFEDLRRGSSNDLIAYYFVGFHIQETTTALLMVPFDVKQNNIIWKLYKETNDRFCLNRKGHLSNEFKAVKLEHYELWNPVSNVIDKRSWKGVNKTICFKQILKNYKDPINWALAQPIKPPVSTVPKINNTIFAEMQKHLDKDYRFKGVSAPTDKDFIAMLKNKNLKPFSEKISLSAVLSVCEKLSREKEYNTMYVFLYKLFSDHSFIFKDLNKPIALKDITITNPQGDIDKLFGKCICNPNPNSNQQGADELQALLMDALFENGSNDSLVKAFQTESIVRINRKSFFSNNLANPKHDSAKHGNYIKLSLNLPYGLWVLFDSNEVPNPKTLLWDTIKKFSGFTTANITKQTVYYDKSDEIDENSDKRGKGGDEEGIQIYGFLQVIMLSILDLSQTYKLSVCVQGFGEKAYVKVDIPIKDNNYFPFNEDKVVNDFVDKLMNQSNATMKHSMIMVKFILLLSNLPWIECKESIIELGTGIDWSASYSRNGDTRRATCMLQPLKIPTSKENDITSNFDENNSSIFRNDGMTLYPTGNGLFSGALAGSTCKVEEGISKFDGSDINLGSDALNNQARSIINETNEHKLFKESQVYRCLWVYLLSRILGIAGSSSIHCKADVIAAFKSAEPVTNIIKTIEVEALKQNRVFGDAMSYNNGGPVRNEMLSKVITIDTHKPDSIKFKDINLLMKEKLVKIFKSQFAICSRGNYSDNDNVLLLCQLILKMVQFMGNEVCNFLGKEQELFRLADIIDVMWGIDTLLLRGAYIPGRNKNLCFFGSVLNCLNRPVTPALGPFIWKHLLDKINSGYLRMSMNYVGLDKPPFPYQHPFLIKKGRFTNSCRNSNMNKVCIHCYRINDMNCENCSNDKCRKNRFVKLDRGREHTSFLCEVEKLLKANQKQFRALKLATTDNDGLIITGKGGSGKSFFIKSLRLFYDFMYGLNSVKVLCYQNKQTDIIQGETINSFFMLGLVDLEQFNNLEEVANMIWKKIQDKIKNDNNKKTLAEIFKILSVQIFIFDESQLIPSFIFDLIDILYKKMIKYCFQKVATNDKFLNGKKFIISCDPKQLGAILQDFNKNQRCNLLRSLYKGNIQNVLQSKCLRKTDMKIIEFTKNNRIANNQLVQTEDVDGLLSTEEVLDAIRMNDDKAKVLKAIDQISSYWGKLVDVKFLKVFLSESLSILDIEFEEYLKKSMFKYISGNCSDSAIKEANTILQNFYYQFHHERQEEDTSIAHIFKKREYQFKDLWDDTVRKFLIDLKKETNLTWDSIKKLAIKWFIGPKASHLLFSQSSIFIDDEKKNKYIENINNYIDEMTITNKRDETSDWKKEVINIIVTKISEQIHANIALMKYYQENDEAKANVIQADDGVADAIAKRLTEMDRFCITRLVNERIDTLLSSLDLYVGCRVTATADIGEIKCDDKFIVTKILKDKIELQNCMYSDQFVRLSRMNIECKIKYKNSEITVTRCQYPLKYSNIYTIHECIGFEFNMMFISLLRFGRHDIDQNMYTLMSRLMDPNKALTYPRLNVSMIRNNPIMDEFLNHSKDKDNEIVSIRWDDSVKKWVEYVPTDQQEINVSEKTTFYNIDEEDYDQKEEHSNLNLREVMVNGLSHLYPILMNLCADCLGLEIVDNQQTLFIDSNSQLEAVNVLSKNLQIENLDTIEWTRNEYDQKKITNEIMEALIKTLKTAYTYHVWGKNVIIQEKHGFKISNTTLLRCSSSNNKLKCCTDMNDVIIDFYMAMLQKREEKNISYFLKSGQVEEIWKLLEDKNTVAIDDMLKGDHQIDYKQSYFRLFFPIQGKNSNENIIWGLAVIYFDEKKIWFSDDLIMDTYSKLLKQFISSIWFCNEEEFECSYHSLYHDNSTQHDGLFTMLCADYLSNNWDIRHVDDNNIRTFRPTLCSYLLNGLLNPILNKSHQSQYERMQRNCNSQLSVTDFYQYKSISKNNYKVVRGKDSEDLMNLLIKLINDTNLSEATYETNEDKFLTKWLEKLRCPSNYTLANMSKLAKCRIFVYKNFNDSPHSYHCQEIYDFSSSFKKNIFLLHCCHSNSYDGLEVSKEEDISEQSKKRKNADHALLLSNKKIDTTTESRRSKTKYDEIGSSNSETQYEEDNRKKNRTEIMELDSYLRSTNKEAEFW